ASADLAAFKGPDVRTDIGRQVFVIVRNASVRTVDDLPAAKISARDIDERTWRRPPDREVDLARAAELEVGEATCRSARSIGEIEFDRSRAAVGVQRAREIEKALRIRAGEAVTRDC